jgi:hypothetical protein
VFRVTGCLCGPHQALDAVEFSRFAIVLHLQLGLDPQSIVENLAKDIEQISRIFPGVIARA